MIAGGLSSITLFGYAGGYTDPTGLIYLVNRYYDPSTGQFLSVDPLVGITDQPYQYVGGDPLNFIDPLGLACWAALELGFTQASRNCWKSGYKTAWHHPTRVIPLAIGSGALAVGAVLTVGVALAMVTAETAAAAEGGIIEAISTIDIAGKAFVFLPAIGSIVSGGVMFALANAMNVNTSECPTSRG